jgi:hypothetical protein
MLQSRQEAEEDTDQHRKRHRHDTGGVLTAEGMESILARRLERQFR